MHRRRCERAHDHRQETEDDSADDRPGQRSLAAGDHHDHHRHGVDEQENVGIDDLEIVRVQASGATGDRRGHDRRQHEIARHVDADRACERLVFLQRNHGAADAGTDQPADDEVSHEPDDRDEVVVGGLAPERVVAEPGKSQGERRDVGERQRTLRQLHPVQRDQPRHLGEADRDDDEIGAAHLERQLADQRSRSCRR